MAHLLLTCFLRYTCANNSTHYETRRIIAFFGYLYVGNLRPPIFAVYLSHINGTIHWRYAINFDILLVYKSIKWIKIWFATFIITSLWPWIIIIIICKRWGVASISIFFSLSLWTFETIMFFDNLLVFYSEDKPTYSIWNVIW